MCGRFLEDPAEKIVCRECLDRLDAPGGPVCVCCGRFFARGGEAHLCGECLEKPPPFSRHRSAGVYDGVLRGLILVFKYGKAQALGGLLAGFMCRAPALQGEDIFAGVDYVVPVPLHRRRKRRRGFNQALVLSRELAKRKKLRVLARGLVRVKDSPPQASLGALERGRNIKGVFRPAKRRRLKGKIILLVDDVYTTGATVKECSLALLEAGAAEVRVVTVARV